MAYTVIQLTQTPLLFFMTLASDHISPAVGLGSTPVAQISKNGAGFINPAGSTTEVGLGWYKVAGSLSDLDTLGPLALHATGTGADPSDEEFTVVTTPAAGGSGTSVNPGVTSASETASLGAETNQSVLIKKDLFFRINGTSYSFRAGSNQVVPQDVYLLLLSSGGI